MLDKYVYPGTNILKNKYSVTDNETLSDIESACNYEAINKGLPMGDFSLSHMQDIHRKLFGKVYDWAGELRDVDISKGDTTFCRKDYINSEGNRLLNKLINKEQLLTNCNNKTEFVNKMADYYCELNVIHPFREGNGRTTRAFFSQLSEFNGYTLDLSSVSRDEWIKASIDGYNLDNSSLEKIINNSLQVTPQRAIILPHGDNVIMNQSAKNEIENFINLEVQRANVVDAWNKETNGQAKTELGYNAGNLLNEIQETAEKTKSKLTNSLPVNLTTKEQLQFKSSSNNLLALHTKLKQPNSNIISMNDYKQIISQMNNRTQSKQLNQNLTVCKSVKR